MLQSRSSTINVIDRITIIVMIPIYIIKVVQLNSWMNKCNGWVGQDLCMPNVCPPFDVDKDQVRL